MGHAVQEAREGKSQVTFSYSRSVRKREMLANGPRGPELIYRFDWL
jgi:hypothetical protein